MKLVKTELTENSFVETYEANSRIIKHVTVLTLPGKVYFSSPLDPDTW